MGSYQRNKKASSNRSLDQCTRLCFSGSRLKKSNLAHGISLENTQDLYSSFCRSVIPFDCPVDQHEVICEYKKPYMLTYLYCYRFSNCGCKR